MIDLYADLRGDRDTIVVRLMRRLRRLSAFPIAAIYDMLSVHGRARLIRVGGPVVSLTSHGDRVLSVHRTIESIGRGRVKPSRLILWLDDEAAMKRLSRPLFAQVRRGLDVRLTDNFGPHTKYFPLVLEQTDSPQAFVTADDDIIYPHWWLDRLVREARSTPGTVVCYRAHRLRHDDSVVQPYDEWPSVESSTAHATVFATGVSGVFYPSGMARALGMRGDEFLAHCPSADDVWLHHTALHAGIPVRQIGSVPRHFCISPSTQAVTLMSGNLEGGNDAAMARLYGPAEVALLKMGGSWADGHTPVSGPNVDAPR